MKSPTASSSSRSPAPRSAAVAVAVLATAACATARTERPTAPPPAGSTTSAPAPAAPLVPGLCAATIARTWHGRVAAARADEYAAYLGDAITKFRALPGNLGYQLMRETIGAETHFTVISYWATRDAIHSYAGADITRTRHLPRDAEFLIDPEQTVKNYELVVQNLDCPAPR
jgi:heme-degrading monooxygenase HmoA